MSSNSLGGIHDSIKRCIASVNSHSADCGHSFAMLSSMCANIGMLSESGNRPLFLLLAFSLPVRQLGERLQALRTKLRALEMLGAPFAPEAEAIAKYHSNVTGEIERTLETFEGIIDTQEIDYEKIVSELLAINKYIFGLQEQVSFIDQIFNDLPSASGNG